ncbi:Uncharacterised protein [Mycobacteroides abscessus subsp. abscessus]|nr:Uncharacterised protein [Mycobacteroides abscessus subsp. abscessus]
MRAVGSCLSRSRRAVARRSASSGTVGVSSGTVPSASPTTSSAVTTRTIVSSPPHITDRTASVTSDSPASGRSRSVASVCASRTASMTCALDTGRSCARNTPATLVSHRAIGCSGVVNRWWYQPGESMPAP